MAPESKHTMVERFVSDELSGAELDNFQSLMLTDPSLSKDIELSLEVEEALSENDIINLRQKLQEISVREGFSEPKEIDTQSDAYFGLADEIEKVVNLDVEENGLNGFGNFLQKLHIFNHVTASKETVHEIYRPEEVISETDNEFLSAEDEMLFGEIEMAVGEKDILDLRANLQSISASISHHEFSNSDIEDFVNGEADEETRRMIAQEMMINEALAAEIELFGEIDMAIAESDIMGLRASLGEIMGVETSHTRSVNEIDDYITGSLDDSELASFEDELLSNPGLVAEIKLNKEINEAIGEDDVMALRRSLQSIRHDETQNDKEQRGFSAPRRKQYMWYAAASLALLLAIGGLIRTKNYTNTQVYAEFYQPYSGLSNISRSAASNNGELMNQAVVNIESGDNKAALSQLSQILSKDSENYTANFYSGLAYQADDENTKAIEAFNKVIQHGDNLFVEQSEWYIGMCYLNNEERDKAIAQFRKIVAENGYYSSQARSILNRLE